jgi:hypothetical protein
MRSGTKTKGAPRAASAAPTASGARSTRVPSDDQILERLHQVLSEDEIRRVLAACVRSLDEAGLARLEAHVGTKTAAALRGVLAAGREGAAGFARAVVPGSEKIRQEWKKLWRDWHQSVDEASGEHGEYVQQDERWEALERIAPEMRRLLPRVWDEGLDPNLSVATMLEDADEAVRTGPPEWMARVEELSFEKETTRLLLEWEWRRARRDGETAFVFAERIAMLEQSSMEASLSQDAISTFVTGLGPDEQRAILHGMVQFRDRDPWRTVLAQPHSGWFRAYVKLAATWSPDLHTEVARANIAQDYALALPLMSAGLKRRAYAEVVSLAEAAARSLLGLRTQEKWDPDATLLVRQPAMRSAPAKADADVVRLLDTWRRGAAGLGRTELASALEIQAVVAKNRDGWDAILAAFDAARKPCEALFADWRTDAAERSVGSEDVSVRARKGTAERLNWVETLVDTTAIAETNAEAARRMFLDVVRQFLEAVGATRAILERCKGAFEVLALDVGMVSKLDRRYPKLHRLLARNRGTGGPGDVRRRWLARLGGEELAGDIVRFCGRHADLLVPDPGEGRGSNYDDCAKWVAAIVEIDRPAAEVILRRWAADHRRRRNLWTALSTHGMRGRLPDSEGTSS